MRAFVVVMAIAGWAGHASAATFTVTSTLDSDDKSADGKCADANNKCTLRAAITEANRTATADVIEFNITGSGSKTIVLVSNPPGFAPPPLSITTPLTIDATTQSGYAAGAPAITIDGDTLGMRGIDVRARGVEIRGLRIKNFREHAIGVYDDASCVIRANEITDSVLGIEVQAGLAGAGPTLIGGAVTADRNVFSRNGTGISLWNGAHDVEIAGNLIGTDGTGTAAAGNTSYGVLVEAASVTIHDNVISGNQTAGIQLGGAGEKLVENNLIGTDITGTAAIPNNHGIRVRGPGAEIAGNTISGNSNVGVFLTSAQCVGAKVHGNRIGTTASGTAALGNEYGIQIDESASGSTIGGTAAADRNVISGNYLGIYVINLQPTFDITTQTRDHQIVGNYIGPASDGTALLGNQLAVYLYGAARNSLVGNRIQGNLYSGVAILGQFALDNTVRQNVISSNGGQPIDLEYDGVTVNDSFDSDVGANYHQNFPILQVANQNGMTQLGGTLSSSNLQDYTLDFYSTSSCSSGTGPSAYLTSATVSTNAAGNAPFLVTIPTVPLGSGIFATATSSSGSTSEMSYCATVSDCIAPQIATSIPQATVGYAYQQQLGGFFETGPYTYTLVGGSLPAGMSLSTDGWLTGLPQDAGTFTFTVRVADLSGCSADYELSLFVCPLIDITPPVLPRVQPNVPLDITFTADGGQAPYQFYFQDVPTPGFIPGVQLYPQGHLAGTPSTIGIYTFTLAAYDATGCVGQRSYSLVVGCSALYFEPAQLPLGDVGAAYDVVLRANGGTPPYRFLASQLPEGLEMSAGGRIHGKPRVRGLTPVTITVIDGVGCMLEVTLGLEVVVLDEPGCESTTGTGSPALVLFVVAMLVRRRRKRAVTA